MCALKVLVPESGCVFFFLNISVDRGVPSQTDQRRRSDGKNIEECPNLREAHRP